MNFPAVEISSGQLKEALREIENQPDDSVLLKDKLRIIKTKLAKLADAIETVGVNNTLANRLAILEQEKADTEMALERVPSPITGMLFCSRN